MMPQEEKSLLLQDLCARLPYGVICDRLGKPKKLLGVYPTKKFPLEFDNGEYMPNDYKLEDIKPYLRPRSEISNLISAKEFTQLSGIDLIDWYNANHIDYRTDDEGKTMIEKGLALEAPEGMYNTNEK